MGATFLTTETGETVSCFGVRVDILLTGEDTEGAYATYRCVAEPGRGAPLHVHLIEDEAFFVLEGQFAFQCGEEMFTAGVSSQVRLPKGIPHAFQCIGEVPGIAFVVSTPGGHENFFRDAGMLPPGPPPLEEAIALCRRHNIELVLPGK